MEKEIHFSCTHAVSKLMLGSASRMKFPSKPLYFHIVGLSSLVSLLLVLLYVAAGLLRGDLAGLVRKYFDYYPGLEPFIIFIFPVVLVGAWAWLRACFTDGNTPESKEDVNEGQN